MALINLDSITASGVYTSVVDASQTQRQVNEYGRLVIGSSKIGPFNTIVSLQSDAEKRAIFGQNDKALEKKGSYFHKAIDVLLNEGDVYALNVLPIDVQPDSKTYSNPDRGSITAFNTMSGGSGYASKDVPIYKLFNRQRFWGISQKEIIRTKNEIYSQTNSSVLNFASTSQKPITVFVKKADLLGYDVSVEEWYAMLGPDYEIPSFLHKDDYISDYMINVIAVEGNFTNYDKLDSDPIYGTYFDKNGLIVSKLNEFYQLKNVNVIINLSGCIIPEFKDNMGRNISIDRLINNKYASTQLACAIDTNLLDSWDGSIGQEIDIIGNELVANNAPSKVEVLSYKLAYNEKVKSFEVSASDINTDGEQTFISAANIEELNYLIMNDILVDGDKITVSSKAGESPEYSIEYIAAVELDGENGRIFVFDNAGNAVNLEVKDYIIEVNLSKVPSSILSTVDIADSFLRSTSNTLTLFFDNDTLYNEFITSNPMLKVGNFLKAKISDNVIEGEAETTYSDKYSKILRILSISDSKNFVDGSPDYTEHTLTIKVKSATETYIEGIDTNDNILTVVANITNVCTSLYGKNLSEFKLRADLLPNGTSARQNQILSYLFENTNLASAIQQSEIYDIRYIVDSYEGDMSQTSKYYLSKLAAKHEKCAVFTNYPSMRQFEENTDPSFIDTTTGLVNCKHIADGGNLSLNPSFAFKLASESINGVPMESFNIPAFPNLIISDNGITKSMIPAPYVCNSYMRKFQSGNPYAIVAGPNGKLTEQEILGVEYELTDDDRALLEPKGVNLIINKRRGGVMLFSNNTAYQTVKSALNNAHVRDTLTTIQKNTENILYNFLFKFNTPIVRMRVKSLVDEYLTSVTEAQGLASFETIIDSTNNDRDVIESNGAIIDIYVDFNRGIHKFLNRITITRVGGELSITSSGFSPI